MLDDRSYMRATHRPYWSMTTILLVSLVVCFVIQQILAGVLRPPYNVNSLFALSNTGLRHHYYWQILTFQFMHAGFMHLLLNGVGLYFFGRAMEDMVGPKSMLLLYLSSGTIGGLLQVALSWVLPQYFGNATVLGASAGVFGLIAAFATRAPEQPITFLVFFVIPITFPAKVLLYFFAALALGGLVFPALGGSTAHGAHLGGMLTGVVFARWSGWSEGTLGGWRPFARRRPSRPSLSASTQRAWRRPRKKGEEAASGDFISREVDPILEKISAQGIHSLTERERQILEAARNKMAKR